MPLYQFVCNSCGASFDALIARPTASPTADCKVCGSHDVVRGFGLPAQPATTVPVPTNCRGDGPPCGAAGCGRMRVAE